MSVISCTDSRYNW